MKKSNLIYYWLIMILLQLTMAKDFNLLNLNKWDWFLIALSLFSIIPLMFNFNRVKSGPLVAFVLGLNFTGMGMIGFIDKDVFAMLVSMLIATISFTVIYFMKRKTAE